MQSHSTLPKYKGLWELFSFCVVLRFSWKLCLVINQRDGDIIVLFLFPLTPHTDINKIIGIQVCPSRPVPAYKAQALVYMQGFQRFRGTLTAVWFARY